MCTRAHTGQGRSLLQKCENKVCISDIHFQNCSNIITTKTATRSCRTRKSAFHFCSPGVVRRNHAAARHVWALLYDPPLLHFGLSSTLNDLLTYLLKPLIAPASVARAGETIKSRRQWIGKAFRSKVLPIPWCKSDSSIVNKVYDDMIDWTFQWCV